MLKDGLLLRWCRWLILLLTIKKSTVGTWTVKPSQTILLLYLTILRWFPISLKIKAHILSMIYKVTVGHPLLSDLIPFYSSPCAFCSIHTGFILKTYQTSSCIRTFACILPPFCSRAVNTTPILPTTTTHTHMWSDSAINFLGLYSMPTPSYPNLTWDKHIFYPEVSDIGSHLTFSKLCQNHAVC